MKNKKKRDNESYLKEFFEIANKHYFRVGSDIPVLNGFFSANGRTILYYEDFDNSKCDAKITEFKDLPEELQEEALFLFIENYYGDILEEVRKREVTLHNMTMLRERYLKVRKDREKSL